MPMGVLAGMTEPNSSLVLADTRNPKPETLNPKPETLNPKPYEQMPMGVLAGMTEPNSSIGRAEQFRMGSMDDMKSRLT